MITKKNAKRLSIKKWKFLVENKYTNNKEIIQAIPELEYLKSTCGYCEKYLNTSNNVFKYCAKCPIKPKRIEYNDFDNSGCAQMNSLYNEWNKNRTTENAQKILNSIKKS